MRRRYFLAAHPIESLVSTSGMPTRILNVVELSVAAFIDQFNGLFAQYWPVTAMPVHGDGIRR